MLYGMISYCAMLTDEDLSRYNRISRFKNSLVLAPDRLSDYINAVKCLHFLPYIMAARTAGMIGMKKLRHCRPIYLLWLSVRVFVTRRSSVETGEWILLILA